MTTGSMWFDAPVVSALLLARDSIGTVTAFSSPLFLIARHSVITTPISTSCSPSSGFCTASLSLPPNWFPGSASISYGFSATSTTPLLTGSSALVLNANPTSTTVNNIVLALPQRNMRQGDSFTVSVQGNITNRISLFTLSFTVDVGLSITAINYVTNDWQAAVKRNSAQVCFQQLNSHVNCYSWDFFFD